MKLVDARNAMLKLQFAGPTDADETFAVRARKRRQQHERKYGNHERIASNYSVFDYPWIPRQDDMEF
jgi:hypothetical protein